MTLSDVFDPVGYQTGAHYRLFDSMRDLARFPATTEVMLNGSGITDAVLQQLIEADWFRDVTKLRFMNAGVTEASAEAVARLGTGSLRALAFHMMQPGMKAMLDRIEAMGCPLSLVCY